MGTINVKHNCHKFHCPVVKTQAAQMEREDTQITQHTVNHCEDNHYVINSAALSNQELHRLISLLPVEPTQPGNWLDCVRGGLQCGPMGLMK
jgi:hypothetical protein